MLCAAAMLEAWEVGVDRAPLDRALALLWAAGQPDGGALPLADRDRALIALRRAVLGDTLACLADCPDCGTVLEFELSASHILETLVGAPDETVTLGDRETKLRPLDSRDLADAAARVDDGAALALLRSRAAGDAGPLTPALIDTLDALIDAREAAGEIAVALTCHACERHFEDTLDVASHVWREIEAAAIRLVGEVAEIARAFGWSESEILGLSEARRRAYLALARAA